MRYRFWIFCTPGAEMLQELSKFRFRFRQFQTTGSYCIVESISKHFLFIYLCRDATLISVRLFTIFLWGSHLSLQKKICMGTFEAQCIYNSLIDKTISVALVLLWTYLINRYIHYWLTICRDKRNNEALVLTDRNDHQKEWRKICRMKKTNFNINYHRGS